MKTKTVQITIDGDHKHVTPGLVMGQTLLSLGGVTPPNQLLLEVRGDIDIPVAPGDGILIRGGESFSIGDGEPPIDDNPCLRHPVHFCFNSEHVHQDKLFKKAKVLGSELKKLDPNLKPGDKLYADLDGLADEAIGDDLRLILQPKDCFITVPCGNVGLDITSQHLEEVQKVYPDAKIESEGGQRYLVVPTFRLPEHWEQPATSLLFLIPNGYPMACPDMFWVSPALRLKNGKEPEGASVYQQYFGKQWQRFSWHYVEPQNAWRQGRSSLLTHLQFCSDRLNQAK